MLSNVKLKSELDPIVAILSRMDGDNELQNPSPGIYVNCGFNFNHMVEDGEIISEYPDYWPIPDYDPTWDFQSTAEVRLAFFREQIEKNTFFGSYGVADNIEQVLEKYKPYVDDPEHHFCFSFTEVRKDQQSDWGGWRWHKWGEYIGTQEPQCEYLYDEPVIESVFVFHVYRVKPSE